MPDPTTALYVRLPHDEAAKLDRAAGALATNKKALVTSLVARYVDPDTAEGLTRLHELTERRVTLTIPDDTTTVGRHHFTPNPPPEVLTLAQAAELLQTTEDELSKLAESDAIPARRLGDDWRFSRQALLDWLANP